MGGEGSTRRARDEGEANRELRIALHWFTSHRPIANGQWPERVFNCDRGRDKLRIASFYKLAMSLSTRSSCDLNGSLHSTVRCA